MAPKGGVMMPEGGYIKLYRSLLSWEWYDSIETMRLFLHLLLTANYEPKTWHGILIERGQRLCSIATLSAETNLSSRTVRTCIERLISTGEVTKQTSPQHTIITINNYDAYQSTTSETTNDRQVTDKPPTNDRQQHKKEKKERKKEVYIPPISPIGELSQEAQQAFNDFKQMRQRMRKPLTERAVELAVNRLKEMAPDEATQTAIINQSIEKGWTSFYPLKGDSTAGAPDKYANLKRLREEARLMDEMEAANEQGRNH
jgi:uncharacterized protein YeaO (DUF488 family)